MDGMRRTSAGAPTARRTSLWRLENGELDGVNPKVIVLLAGTNNVGSQPRDEQTIVEIARGLKAIVDLCQRKAPNASNPRQSSRKTRLDEDIR